VKRGSSGLSPREGERVKEGKREGERERGERGRERGRKEGGKEANLKLSQALLALVSEFDSSLINYSEHADKDAHTNCKTALTLAESGMNIPAIIDAGIPSALCPLPSALCPLPSALCPLPSALCPLPSALCPLPSDPLCSPFPTPYISL
jgi:hypothetical protein